MPLNLGVGKTGIVMQPNMINLQKPILYWYCIKWVLDSRNNV